MVGGGGLKNTSSFGYFFRTVLLPELRKFERIRRMRTPTIIGIYLALVAAAVYFIFGIVGIEATRSFLHDLFHPTEHHAIILIMVLIFIGTDLKSSVLEGNPSVILLLIAAIEDMHSWIHKTLFNAHSQPREFSSSVVGPTVQFALPGLKHAASHYISQSELYDSQICNYYFGNYGGRDLFTGRFDDFDMRFSWVKAEGAIRKKNNLEGTALFHGWFFVVAFQRNFQGETMVYRDVAEKNMGWLGRSLQGMIVPKGMELIHLEDAEFERHFKVLSNDQLKARYILSPSFMRKTAALQNRIRGPVSLSFRFNHMYMAFPGLVEYFDKTLPTHPFTDPAYTRHLFQIVKGVQTLTEDVMNNYIMWVEPGQPDNAAAGRLQPSGSW